MQSIKSDSGVWGDRQTFFRYSPLCQGFGGDQGGDVIILIGLLQIMDCIAIGRCAIRGTVNVPQGVKLTISDNINVLMKV